MSDLVTCSHPIWTSSPSLPKRTVIYGSWALHSCVLWCLIQGPTTRQGGERGCVGNSQELRSSGTLISYKYYLRCSHRSLFVWLLSSSFTQGPKVEGRPVCGNLMWLRPTPKKKLTDASGVRCSAHSWTCSWSSLQLKQSSDKSNQSPVLASLLTNANIHVSDLCPPSLSLSLYLPPLFLPYWTHSEIYFSQEQP